jgi:hypothetical protein
MSAGPSLPLLPRRQFLAVGAAALASLLAPGRPAFATDLATMRCRHRSAPPGPHPAPRPGITAEKVLTHEQLGAFANAYDAFDEVRQIPEIVDGIRCHCGCADDPAFYSLLSCYEGEGMARVCEICQGQGRLAFRLHGSGKSLDEIRAAIDARFG